MKLISVTVSYLLSVANAVKMEFADGQCLLGSRDNPTVVTNGNCNSEFADWDVQSNGDIHDFTGSCFNAGKKVGISQVSCEETHVKFNKYNGAYKNLKKNDVTRCMVLRDGNIEWAKCNLANGIYFDNGCDSKPIEPKSRDIETKFIPGNAVITQLGDNQIKITKENGIYPTRMFTSILIKQKCDYYTFKVVNFVTFMNFGYGIMEHGEFETWRRDLGVRGNSIGYFTSTIGHRNIYNSLTGGNYASTKLESGVAKGDTIKVEANDEFVEYSKDGVSIYKHIFSEGENKDLYPVIDLYFGGDEYIFTCFNNEE